MKLKIESYKKAINALDKSILAYKTINNSGKIKSNYTEEEIELFENPLKSGIVKHFEIVYESSWKLMQRWLVLEGGSSSDFSTKRELFRKSASIELISDPNVWMEFHKSRNLVAHTYDEVTAESVIEDAEELLMHAKDFAERLEELNAKR